MLSKDLIERIRARTADPESRFEFPPPVAGSGPVFAMGIGAGAPAGAGGFRTVRFTMGGEPPPEPEPLPAPARAEDIAAAESDLGFALPDDLKQLYTAVADGGYGPGGGLASLAEAVARYRAMLADPPGEGGQTWPDHLLPINLSEPGADCYDLKTGEIVYWDEESLADGDDDRSGDRIWKRSFRAEARSLADWLEAWLAKPTAAERERQMMREGALNHLRKVLPEIRKMTQEEREEVGLGGDDWETEMCRRMGVDPGEV
ncbi:MAG TPA: SMI1/KNR4 family protein [Afifellaceae bacterium]|nr:SMI1/KNR4 family protein [Afifellaceae bacterium]